MPVSPSRLPSVDAGRVAVRDLSESDVPMVLRYWFDSPRSYLESLAVDPEKLPRRREMERVLLEKIAANAARPVSALSALAILLDGEAVGFHTISPLVEGGHGVFHAHICREDLRGRGLAAASYPKACRVFADRFRLERILFKTPVQNLAALRVKEKLGIRCIGEELVGFGIIRDGTRAKVFEWSSRELEDATVVNNSLSGESRG